MFRIRFWLISIVSFITTLLGEGLLKRLFVSLLCGILVFDSSFCNFYLSDRSFANAISPKLELAGNPEPNNSESDGNKPLQCSVLADQILQNAIDAAQDESDNCSGSVREAAELSHIPFTQGNANDQIKWLEMEVKLGRWQKSQNGVEAQGWAEEGRFVVVGFPAKRNGHVAVVVKGPLYKGKYPTVVGGAINPVARSEGNLTVGEVFNRSDRNKVTYYTPKEKNRCEKTQKSDQSKSENKQEDKECELKPARSTGDPHLFTFDGLKYDLQTSGEFILIKSDDGTFEVQARQVPINSSISINNAAAMKVGSDRVALYAKDFPDADTSTPLRVNGKPINFRSEKLSLNSGGQIFRQGSNYIISSPTGEKVLVNLSGSYLDISPFVYNRSGTYSGLLGNVNGKPDDDLQIRGGGNVLKAQSSYNDVNKVLNLAGLRLPGALNTAEKVYFDQLYKEFANSWRVKPKESLFDYPAGKTTKNYADPRFPSQYLTLNMLSPDQIQKARNACTKAKVSQDLIEGCIFDVGFSGLSEFARTTAEISGYVNVVNQLFPQLKIPTPEQTVNQFIERKLPKMPKTCLPVVGCH